jgi:hypothetical protein
VRRLTANAVAGLLLAHAAIWLVPARAYASPQARPASPSAAPGPTAPDEGSNSGTLLIILGIAIIAAAVVIAVRDARQTGDPR